MLSFTFHKVQIDENTIYQYIINIVHENIYTVKTFSPLVMKYNNILNVTPAAV